MFTYAVQAAYCHKILCVITTTVQSTIVHSTSVCYVVLYYAVVHVFDAVFVTLQSLYGPQSAKTDRRVKISKIGFLAQNSSLGLVDDAQSENIGEKWEYMP